MLIGPRFDRINMEMTRAEVEAILGPPTNYVMPGLSTTPSDRYEYNWRGIDGTIEITYGKHPDEEFSPYGPPGMDNPIRRMRWKP
jgi:hypothetical protein